MPDPSALPPPRVPPPPPAAAAVASRRASPPVPLVAAIVAGSAGLAIVLFELFMIHVFVGRAESCSANRDEAYRDCVRGEDVAELLMESLATGLAVASMVLVLRVARSGLLDRSQPVTWFAVALSFGALLLCVAMWIDGSTGGWAPARPQAYDPIPAVWGHLAMVSGTLVGGGVAAILPVGRSGTA
jgi:hypothetical protein